MQRYSSYIISYGYVPDKKNIVIGVLLPENININTDSIILKTAKNAKYKPLKSWK